MATTQIVKVRIDSMTKYGYKANDKFVNYSKNLSETDKAKVVPGAEFEAEYFIADSGKEYLNKVLSNVAISVIPTDKGIGKSVDTERAKHFTPKFTKKEDSSMSKGEWAAKDQRISRQGAVQASAIALAPVVSLEQLPEEMVKLATKMLEFVNS